MTARLDEMGPVDYLIIGYPQHRMTGEAFRVLLDLVDRGIVRILDLAFVRKNDDGSVSSTSMVDLERMKLLEFALFEGASSGLLDESDLDEAGKALQPGEAAGILVYENVWAAPFAAALRRTGGEVIAGGRIPIQEVLAALDATEPVG